MCVRQFIKGLQVGGGKLVVDPPHGHRIGVFTDAVKGAVQNGAMPRSFHFQHNIFLSFDPDDLLSDLQIFPVILVPYLIGICRIQLFTEEIHVIILEHGDAPACRRMMPKGGYRGAGQEITIDAETGTFQVGFVPYGRLCESDVGIIGQDGLTGFGLLPGYYPSIGTLVRWVGQLAAYITGLPGHIEESEGQSAIGLQPPFLHRDLPAAVRPVAENILQIIGSPPAGDGGGNRLCPEGSCERVTHVGDGDFDILHRKR